MRAAVRLLSLAVVSMLLAACSPSVASKTPADSGVGTSSSPLVSVRASLVPALTVDRPTVTVSPATGLLDGETVEVRVTGFGVGGKIWISECASAADATDLGCGAQLAAQPFLVTDNARAGRIAFIVRASAPAQPLAATPIAVCHDECVIVATVGDGYADAVAPISFTGAATSGAATAWPSSSMAATSLVPLTRTQAIAIARRLAVGSVASWSVQAEAGPFHDFAQPPEGKFSPPTPSPDRWVWHVMFVSAGGSVSAVIIDYYTGRLIESEAGTP